MAPRAASPALSENEFDIFDNLAGSDAEEQGNSLGANLGIDLDVGSDGGSDDEAFIAAKQAASNRKAANVKGTGKKGGGFQAMGLNALLLKAIAQKGFKMATPIQRKAIPLLLQGDDVVGMARTGSGKTAAFVIPMIEKLKTHSAKVGARGIIMSPSRELALQTLKVVKELGRGTDLRTILLVGGDSLEEQFSSMTTNPDIIIATPGRFLHLKVEMGLDLSSVRYICFDEADRLFEMGFASQLAEILHALPTSRQTLLFSATLPKSLVEFARAGLQEPKLIRLDAESKISPDLKSAYFTIKSGDRDGALLYLLEQVIKVPAGETEASKARKQEGSLSVGAKRKRKQFTAKDAAVAESTIIFAATKHRVEYLSELLKSLGYPVSYLYGNLDQTARKAHVEEFRSGLTRILVVTDVAARGVDMPHINHVINYDFPSQPKICVHRVGRTARAGRKGWAYSLVRHVDLPYLLDLQLFLGQRLLVGRTTEEANFAEDFVVGSLAPYQLEGSVEVINKQLADDEDLLLLQSVADKGERQYQRTRNQASAPSVHRTKELLANPHFADTHVLFKDEVHDALQEKEKMLARIQGFRPAETVFEIGRRGTQSETAEIMRRRRVQVERQQQKQRANALASDAPVAGLATAGEADKMEVDSDDDDDVPADTGAYDPDSDSDELEVSVSMPSSKKPANDDFREGEFFMSYLPKENYAEEKAYGVSGGDAGNNFVSAARSAEMSLVNDEIQGFADASKARMRWDKKSKKYVARANDEDGSKGAKMIRGESGQKIAASFRSGRFDDWRKANKIGRMPRVGELEAPGRAPGKTQHYKHKAEKAPKEADRYRDDYEVQKKRVQEAKEKRVGKFKDGTGKSELKDVNAVQKQRKVQEQRQKKNARPSKKRKF